MQKTNEKERLVGQKRLLTTQSSERQGLTNRSYYKMEYAKEETSQTDISSPPK